MVLGSADSVAGFHFVERTFGTAISITDGSSTVILSREVGGTRPAHDRS